MKMGMCKRNSNKSIINLKFKKKINCKSLSNLISLTSILVFPKEILFIKSIEKFFWQVGGKNKSSPSYLFLLNK